MRTKLALALSTLGVLGAGSAAALVNTDILDGGQATSGASAAILPPPVTVELTVPPPTTTVSPATTPLPTTQAATTPPAVPTSGPTGMLTTFNVGAAGTVTVDVINGALVFVGAEPAAGWAVSDTDHERDDNEVEVEFRSADTRVEFTAHFRGGTIVPEVESESLSTVTTLGAGNHDDDDDDDGHDDDDDDDSADHDEHDDQDGPDEDGDDSHDEDGDDSHDEDGDDDDAGEHDDD